MADVSGPRRRRSDGERRGGDVGTAHRDRDRGQLLLVGALALAVLFVALALLLNTAIYTGTLATRDAGGDATPAIEYVSASQSAGVDAVRSVNRRNNTSATNLTRAFTARMNRWDDLATHHKAVAGTAADVDVAGTTNGTRIQQDDADRNYTDKGGNGSWTVVDGAGVTAVRSLRFTVDDARLASVNDAGNATTAAAFNVNVTSDADVDSRTAYVYNNSSRSSPEVLVVDGSDELICPVESSGTFVVDISNTSVDGASCSLLGTLDDTEGEVSVEYDNGDAASGTYTMVVDEPPPLSSELNDPDEGSPYSTDAIYGANLTVTYRTADLDYEATIEVVPE